MFVPFRVRGLELANRVCVSPMAQYRAKDGTPNEWHSSHYAERRQRRRWAGVYGNDLRFAGRPHLARMCRPLYASEHLNAWQRIVEFVHAETDAKIAIQLGHSGAKGSTQLGWEESDAPLATGNWPVLAPSAVAWSPQNQTPREMARADMDQIRDEFVRSAEMAARIGFDWLELHYAHGYLMSSFITAADQQAHR